MQWNRTYIAGVLATTNVVWLSTKRRKTQSSFTKEKIKIQEILKKEHISMVVKMEVMNLLAISTSSK
jgi:Rad3-related DNA helicase